MKSPRDVWSKCCFGGGGLVFWAGGLLFAPIELVKQCPRARVCQSDEGGKLDLRTAPMWKHDYFAKDEHLVQGP